MSQSQELYRAFCNKNHLPIFLQAWWLDVVCNKGYWDVCLSLNKAGEVVGALPYYASTYRGIPVIKMPRLTPYLGAWLIYPEGATRHKKMAFEKRVINDLIAQLPYKAYYMQHFHYTFTNCLPFYWKAFQQSTLYTYIIKKVASKQLQLAQCNRNIRRNIKKAEQELTLETDISPQTFYETLALTFQRQALSMPFSFEFFQKQHQAIQKRQLGKMLVAVDKMKRIHAVAYLLWDKNSAYYHLAGDHPSLRQSGASIWLIWKAMEYAFYQLNLDTFDFLGSTIEPIEAIRRQFGAVQQPHFRIYKAGNRFWEMLRVLSGRTL